MPGLTLGEILDDACYALRRARAAHKTAGQPIGRQELQIVLGVRGDVYRSLAQLTGLLTGRDLPLPEDLRRSHQILQEQLSSWRPNPAAPEPAPRARLRNAAHDDAGPILAICLAAGELGFLTPPATRHEIGGQEQHADRSLWPRWPRPDLQQAAAAQELQEACNLIRSGHDLLGGHLDPQQHIVFRTGTRGSSPQWRNRYRTAVGLDVVRGVERRQALAELATVALAAVEADRGLLTRLGDRQPAETLRSWINGPFAAALQQLSLNVGPAWLLRQLTPAPVGVRTERLRPITRIDDVLASAAAVRQAIFENQRQVTIGTMRAACWLAFAVTATGPAVDGTTQKQAMYQAATMKKVAEACGVLADAGDHPTMPNALVAELSQAASWLRDQARARRPHAVTAELRGEIAALLDETRHALRGAAMQGRVLVRAGEAEVPGSRPATKEIVWAVGAPQHDDIRTLFTVTAEAIKAWRTGTAVSAHLAAQAFPQKAAPEHRVTAPGPVVRPAVHASSRPVHR